MYTGPEILQRTSPFALAAFWFILLFLLLVVIGVTLSIAFHPRMRQRFLTFMLCCIIASLSLFSVYTIGLYNALGWTWVLALPRGPLITFTVLSFLLMLAISIFIATYLDKWIKL